MFYGNVYANCKGAIHRRFIFWWTLSIEVTWNYFLEKAQRSWNNFVSERGCPSIYWNRSIGSCRDLSKDESPTTLTKRETLGLGVQKGQVKRGTFVPWFLALQKRRCFSRVIFIFPLPQLPDKGRAEFVLGMVIVGDLFIHYSSLSEGEYLIFSPVNKDLA